MFRSSILALAVSITLSLPAGMAGSHSQSDWPESTDGVVVFDKGSDGFQCFRIPAVVRVSDGSLLAFAEARRAHGDSFCHDDGSIDLVMKRSTDDGATWSAMQTVLAGDPWGEDRGATRGNPVPIVISQGEHAGRIVLLSTWNVEGSRSERRPFVQFSDDDGHTWSDAVDLTEQLKVDLPEKGWYATGPQHGIEMKNGPHAGRLVAGVNYEGGRGALIFSDDAGVTWQHGADAARPTDADHFSEVGVEEAADGSLYAIGRSRKGEKSTETREFSRAANVSKDGGATFEKDAFGFQSDLLTTPEVQGSIVNADQASGAAGNTLVYAAPQHGTLRKDLGLFVSHDGGGSWVHVTDMTRNRSGYSDLVMLDDSTVGVLYETGLESGDARDRIVFDTASLQRS
ncbi:exo-alpha-sialidase [Brachybacterium sp. p3-SID957]|uniref:sialidase family protein n=1 Tax=Brachybacterium sp. p3-SID957 TaxID=2916049 RepID=UPI00223BDFF7|nr:sialidase family protein [Brachybacterium sp. p3-SID957]MCT1776275.1 glycoside hydrolase [Brachybacterium sp. p3-SID957]